MLCAYVCWLSDVILNILFAGPTGYQGTKFGSVAWYWCLGACVLLTGNIDLVIH